MRHFAILAVLAALAVAFPAAAEHAGKSHKLALQVSDNDPAKMNAVLNVAANVSKHYSNLGHEVEIEIVAFNAGLHMLREDTSPVKERLANFTKSMSNVTFDACMNTVENMTKIEGKPVPLLSFAKKVPAGVVTLIELGEHGWTIVRP